MKQGFIGFGNLAEAVYRGLREEKEILFGYFDICRKEVGIPYHEKMADLVAFADIIWLTIKPQDLKDVLEQLKQYDLTGKTVVSPVAGKTIAYIEQFLGEEQRIIRIMPNLAIAYRESVTAFSTNQPKSAEAIEIFNLLEKLGKTVRLEEGGFDLFTSIFGSGPAFILAFIQAFKKKMLEFNLPDPLLDELLLGLTCGTTTYFTQNHKNYSIEELIRNITSKGGTTEAGLEYFNLHQIGKQLEGVLDAARRRSEEMSRTNF